MKKDIKRNKRPGFTLVELLIVIIIIGILAGGMMMVAGAGTDKANATKIVSDLRNLKSAALMYYADKTAWPTKIGDLSAYIDRTISGDYEYNPASGDLVGYKGALLTTGVIEKLVDMATASGLCTKDGAIPYVKASQTDGVWMKVR
ncbi:MAG: prepilin-type N-terminal cleavage/methylation domain-containing protein [Dethiosulfovibrio sp.]|nr:prepilin-type N-terminal cleavage/methylation domain-containing protein [Dethiosulfovibrio sp.]